MQKHSTLNLERSHTMACGYHEGHLETITGHPTSVISNAVLSQFLPLSLLLLFDLSPKNNSKA